MQKNYYEEEHVIPCYMTDTHETVTPAGFMNYAQEAADRAATTMGFGYDILHKKNWAWVLSRYHIKFLEPLHWQDKMKLTTWHKGMNSLFFVRDFDVEDSQGRHAIAATSSWIVFNTATRSFVSDVSEVVPDWSERHVDVIADPAPKIVVPRSVEFEKVADHPVSYSDIDILGHTNNVRYVVWSMDVIGNDITFKKPCRELFINFNAETHVGQTVELYRHIEGDTVFVKGMVDGKQSFICKFLFG